MRSLFLVFIMLFTACSKNLKIVGNNQNNINMEKFDIIGFRDKNHKINKVLTEIKGDTIFEYCELEDSFIKNTKLNGSPIQNKKVYYKDNYNIKAESNYFFKFPFGVSKKYDRDGKLKESKDWEENYNFSIDSLVEKMNKEFKIDLNKPDNLGVDRRYELSKYIYVIVKPRTDSANSVREIKIDGNTGNVISDETVYLKK